jgi:signal transduction histidine kinase
VIHLLLISEESLARLNAATLLTSPNYKTTRKDDLDAARDLLRSGVFDLVILLGCLSTRICEIKEAAGSVPLVVATELSAETEQIAYSAGADLVIRTPLVLSVFEKATRPLLAPMDRNPSVSYRNISVSAPVASLANTDLEVLRNFSRVLGYSLDHKLFTQHFVLKLREVLNVNRIALFLEPAPSGTLGQTSAQRSRDRLTCVAAVGISNDLLECIELSRLSGIGQHITRYAQIIRAEKDGAPLTVNDDAKIQREFDVLGCQVALPINDRERTLGVALIGGRVTGKPLEDTELQLVYHLLEELGLAVKNSWLHHQLASSHRLFSDVLGAITSGSVVVGADLTVQHANRAFLRFLRGESNTAESRVDFTELPPSLASALHDLAENGKQAAPFFVVSEKNAGRSYRVSLVPFPSSDNRLPQPAMALVEDFTQIQAVQKAEVEASNLKLIALIAKRFAHEIRNSLVPLSTHHQLIDTDYLSPEFRASLKSALGRETGRIQRFTEQMLFLSQPAHPADGWIPVGPMLRSAFQCAATALGKDAHLEITGQNDDTEVRVHQASITHALEEIFLNGLQETPSGGVVRVVVDQGQDAKGNPVLNLRFRDEGVGFTQETKARAIEPFFTTRTTGVGLGLTVARRIIENHSGRLDVNEKLSPTDPDIVIHIPLG